MAKSHPIEKWYSGKGLDTLRTYVLPTLAEAEKLGYWPKGASRKVKAALNKAKVAEKLGRENRVAWAGIGKGEWASVGQICETALTYGQFEKAPDILVRILGLSAAQRIPLSKEETRWGRGITAEQWARDFAPVANLVALLDRSRPRPTFVLGTLSPTVYANLGKALGVDFTSVRSPEIVWEWVEYVDGNGKKVRYQVGRIIWPEGTQHNKSRYYETDSNQQCQACGHAIRNPWNWVPLLADGPQGPLSLWVGRDCAGKLFGVKVDGDAQYEGRVS